MRIETSIDIAASSATIWDVMIDVTRWPDWTPTVTSVELLDSGPLRVGTRVRIRQPKLPVAVWTVSALEAGRGFTWTSVTPGLTSVADHRIDARGTSTVSRVTLSVDWRGWMTPLIRLIFGTLSRRYVRTEAESLKRRCESTQR
jgi:hypothetical protein